MTPIVVKPSSLLENGIEVENVNTVNLFKITDKLQTRMQKLVDKKTADSLTPQEAAEIEAIGELVVIVSYINGMLVSEVHKNQPTETWEQKLDKN